MENYANNNVNRLISKDGIEIGTIDAFGERI